MSKLPDNWKPCEVNYPPNLNQYQINAMCVEMVSEFWSMHISEEEDAVNMAHVGLYRLLPKLFDSYNFHCIPSSWKPCI